MSDAASDLRRRERRRRGPVARAESWFGGSALERETAPLGLQAPFVPDPDSAFDAGIESFPADDADGAPDDSAGADAPAQASRRAAGAAAPAFERIFRLFVAARAVLGIALVVALIAGGLFGLRPNVPVTTISVAYAALAISLWAWLKPSHAAPPSATTYLSRRQWLATIGIDLVAFIALHVMAPGSSLNYSALLVLPVLMAGVLTPRVTALATAAAITIGLLGAARLAVLGGAESTTQTTQAALAGIGFFVIAVVASELASRLAREQRAARGSREMARQQAQLNQLVIEEMQDGVLVVDRRGRVRAANPAARRLLAPSGMCRDAPFQLRGVPAWQSLVEAVERAFGEAAWPSGGRDVTLDFRGLGDARATLARTLRLRVGFTTRREPQAVEELCVLFLEDVRNMQARGRQEKLAAMGRVSAGIAHEIRNPLAAIAQANGLLAEDVADPALQRLTDMVAANVERLKRIVEDVMEVASDAPPESAAVDLNAQIAGVCAEWAQAHAVAAGAGGVLRLMLPAAPLGVRFDAEHLRRVLVNLLDNAHRHASGKPGAIEVRLESRHEAQAFLGIASDGPPIPPEVEPHLFEPFFSTRSRGTGLGLYICRELCERYGARIDYRVRGAGERRRNEFFVEMQRRPLPLA